MIASVLFLGALPFAAPSQGLPARPSQTRIPVVLELFTSEGCSSCPPADRLLKQLDEQQPVPGVELIVLSEHVDYWNRLGWKDPFSSGEFSQRQEAYAARHNSDDVYTPQVIVDGRFSVVGGDRRALLSAIGSAASSAKISIEAQIEKEGGRSRLRVTVTAPDSKFEHATLFLAVASNEAHSHVTRGENSGRDLVHVAVAEPLEKIAQLTPGRPLKRDFLISLPEEGAGKRVILFLQDNSSAQIVGATELGL